MNRPPPTSVPPELLRTFVVVCDARSFTGAALKLGLTQPGVSGRMRRLQTMLKVSLFDKSAPGVVVTAKGEIILKMAREILAVQSQLVEAADASRAGPRP
jgi:DNA-binding transcriptional LysR family regulator